MSRENVEIVRSIYEAVGRRDGVTPFEVYADDVVWDISHARVAFLYSREIYRGHEGVREAWREFLSAFGQADFDIAEMIDDGGHVVVVLRERHVGRSSGVPVEASHVAVWTLADGKVTHMRIYDDRAAALEAAGISE